MAAPPVTPVAGLISAVALGGTAAPAVPGGISGGFITNPSSASEQGLGAAEALYVDPVGAAGTSGHGTTFTLQPGQSWPLIPGQTTQTSVNAISSGHRFSVVYWL